MPAESEQLWQEICSLKWINKLTQYGSSVSNIAIKGIKLHTQWIINSSKGNKNETTIFHVWITSIFMKCYYSEPM